MNHNENDNYELILNVYFHRFVNVVHENLWYEIDEYEIVQLNLNVVVVFHVSNHYQSNDANDFLHNNLLMDIFKKKNLRFYIKNQNYSYRLLDVVIAISLWLLNRCWTKQYSV